ncbi:hypothetical protein [Maribacter antarcticus]|uniref:hypothetical protein n=1 Tax=Maribacter antarcticus TaxID=505250 RepID=UPI00047D76AB|nr:hypothetical protein [Maribacter antarcticus]
MKKGFEKYKAYALLGLLLSAVLGCSITQTSYQREYNKIWREMVKSEAWQKSLEKQAQKQELYASADNEMVVVDEPLAIKGNRLFEKDYQSLVSRAYFKIITEAEKADVRISSEYKMLEEQEKSTVSGLDKQFKKRKEMVSKKYKAHKAMLGGLKSWNIFSENKSGDLDYFKAENRDAVSNMKTHGETNAQIVNFLIYKMADLYHLEE